MRHDIGQRLPPCLFWLPALVLLLPAGDARAQPFPGAPPALGWDDLRKCELVVVGQLKSHEGASLSLELVDVLRGRDCKPGEVLRVKLSQGFAVKLSPRHGDRVKPGAQIPRICWVHEERMRLQEYSVVFDAERPHLYFFPRADRLIVDRPSQMQPDRRDGWRQALAGKPIDLSFRLLQEIDPGMRKKAVAELFESRDRQAIAALVDALLEPPTTPCWHETQAFLERLLVGLGDNKGDLYDPVLKAHSSGPGQNYSHTYRLGRILARADSKRAVADFRKLLEPGSRVSRDGICWSLHALESEEGLDLQFEMLQAGERQALDSIIEMMFNRQPIGTPGVKRARVQDLAVPRLQKLLKARTLSRDLQGYAMYWENFGFMVEEPPADQHWRFGGFQPGMNGRPYRKGFPEWDRTVYEASGDLEPMLKADLVEGRKMLRARLANPDNTRPHDLLVSQHLAYLYGDADMAAKYRKPADPIVRYRDTSTARYHRAPYSVFMKLFAETPKVSGAYWARIIGFFPDHPQDYFREMIALIQSDNENHRHFAIVHQFQNRFYWDFDLDPKDFDPVRDRQLEAVKPLLTRMSKGNMLEMRAVLLEHFGVKLPGPPGKGWLPTLHRAAMSWNATIKFNAFALLGMIEEDPEIERFAQSPLSIRQKALETYLKNREALRKEAQPLTETRLLALWKDLDSEDRATGYAAMQAALNAPQSTVAWFRQHLKELPPGAGPDPLKVAALIKELGSPMFKVRSQATAALIKMGPGVVPHLRKAVKEAPELEMRRRLEVVLNEFSPNDGKAREVRAVQVLEYMPGPAARALLEELAAGPRDQALTHEAQSALRRLKRFWQW